MAALDVTDPEPLPDDHPLWRSPGVLVSPHVGGDTSAFAPRAVALVREQLTALVRGEPLRNVVVRGVSTPSSGARFAPRRNSRCGCRWLRPHSSHDEHSGGGGDAQGAVAGP